MSNMNELRKHFEANLLDGDEIQKGQMISSVALWEWVEEAVQKEIEAAEIKARIGMVEYYDQVTDNTDMDWKSLFKDNLQSLKYELSKLQATPPNKEKL